MVEWEETRNCSKTAMKWRNMSEMSLATTIGFESNPFILFTPKQWCIEVIWTHQFIGLVSEPGFGKVGWSSSSKSGSQGDGLMENDDEHYESIDQMNNIEIFIHWSSNPNYNTKNEYKELPPTFLSPRLELSKLPKTKIKWKWLFLDGISGLLHEVVWCCPNLVYHGPNNVHKMCWKAPRSCPYATLRNLP